MSLTIPKLIRNIKEVRKITDSELSFKLVESGFENEFKANHPKWVSQRGLGSSNHLVYSSGFSSCQGVVFLEPGVCGALAHNRPEYDPYDFLTGNWKNLEKGIEDPREIFPDTKKVIAVHVRHEYNHSWPNCWIDGALAKIGIKGVNHILIGGDCNDGWMSIGLDVKNALLYVFPSDHPYGLCLDMTKLSGGRK